MNELNIILQFEMLFECLLILQLVLNSSSPGLRVTCEFVSHYNKINLFKYDDIIVNLICHCLQCIVWRNLN